VETTETREKPPELLEVVLGVECRPHYRNFRMVGFKISRCLFRAYDLQRIFSAGSVSKQDVYLEFNIPIAERSAVFHPLQKAGFFGFN
jgi:hypothetical protein